MDFKALVVKTKKLNVLYVEDDVTLLESTSLIFNKFFSQVDTALDGQEGLNKYLDFHTKNNCNYDLVITDIRMPIMSGIEMLGKIFEHEVNQASFIISANNTDSELINFSHPNSSFLPKPFDLTILKENLFKLTQSIDS